MTRIRLLGPAGEVTDAIGVLRGCARLEVASVSDLLPTRGGRRGDRWVRAYLDAAVRAQHRPCHGAAVALWVGEDSGPQGPVHLWTCRACSQTWTTPARRSEVPQ
jgi:hypothetical protein